MSTAVPPAGWGSQGGHRGHSTARGPRPDRSMRRGIEDQFGRETIGELQWGRSSEADNHALAALLDDVHDIFARERLEVEAVHRVVVGRDGLGQLTMIALESRIAQREAGMDTAVVEPDALTDAVGLSPG